MTRSWFDTVSLSLSALAAFAYVYLLPGSVVLTSVIVFGQAHFLITYIYRNKAGKIDRSFALKFVVLAAALGIACWYMLAIPWKLPAALFIVATLAIFVLHYMNDEFMISGTRIMNGLSGSLAGMFAFAALFLKLLAGAGPSVVLASAALSVVFAAIFVYELLGARLSSSLQLRTGVFVFLNVSLPLYFTFYGDANVYKIGGFIILFHYLRWYLRYVDKFWNTPAFGEYVDFVLWCHVVVLLGFFIYLLEPHTGVTQLFFRPLYFYGWTMIHILLTIRSEDYRFSFSS